MASEREIHEMVFGAAGGVEQAAAADSIDDLLF